MKALIIAFTLAVVPLAADAGEAVTYVVGGETFEGYRAATPPESKGLVLIIHDWDGLTEYEMKRADMLADIGVCHRPLRQGQPPHRHCRQEEGDGQALPQIEIACAVSLSEASKRRASRMTKRPW